MKCLIVTGIFPPDIGGPARYVPEIATFLTNKGVNCNVVTLSDTTMRNDCDKWIFPIYKIQRKQNILLRMLVSMVKIYQLSRSSDVVFSNGLYWECAIATFLAREPLIIKIVGDEVWERMSNRGWTDSEMIKFQEKKGLRISFLRMMRDVALWRATSIIVPSQFTKKMVLGWGVRPEKIHVIYNAVEQKLVGRLPFSLHNKLNTHKRHAKKFAVMASRLIPLKRIDAVIHNLKLFPDLGLIIIGDGSEKKYLEALVSQLKLKQRVIFTGSLTSAQVFATFNFADFFVLNSSTENFPHVVLEAMAVNLPILATKVGGVSEIITHGKNGFLIDPKKPKELEEGMRLFSNQPKFANALAEEGKKTVIQYNWEDIGKAVLSLLMAANLKGESP